MELASNNGALSERFVRLTFLRLSTHHLINALCIDHHHSSITLVDYPQSDGRIAHTAPAVAPEHDDNEPCWSVCVTVAFSCYKSLLYIRVSFPPRDFRCIFGDSLVSLRHRAQNLERRRCGTRDIDVGERRQLDHVDAPVVGRHVVGMCARIDRVIV